MLKCNESCDILSFRGPSGTSFKRHTIKYSAQRLHEKGVVLEIEGLPKHQYVTITRYILITWLLVNNFRFRNAVIEITAVDAGVFEVTGRVLGVAMDKVELVFQVWNTCKTGFILIIFLQ